ncbi:MAG: ABC transporter ATP-binding protein [Polaromonas sp.]|nr:ABC transporter ATP-binding protein [Polaromonas sp.]
MLEIADLHSYYGDAHVLHGVNLHVKHGEIVAVLGRNGMGKTSLLRSLMGLSSPQVGAGTIRYSHRDLVGIGPCRITAAGVGYVPQGRRLFPSLTVLEHLTMLLPSQGKKKWKVAELLELFPRLAERLQHRAGQLSGGERQMLAIARALATGATMLLMDEPSEGLAPVIVQHLERVLLNLKADGYGILLVEQNLNSALTVADRIYVIESGSVVLECSREQAQLDKGLVHKYLSVH